MKKKIWAGLAIVLFISGVLGSSNAKAYTTFTDLSSFNAAAGATTVYDFESDTPGLTWISSTRSDQTNLAGMIKPASYSSDPGASRDFGDFTIDATGPEIYKAGVREGQSPGNLDLYVNTSDNVASLNVIFDTGVTAFGFNWIAEGNQSYDHSTFSLGDTTWDLGPKGAYGFFGLVDTTGTIGTTFSFGQKTSNWSAMSIDNITYSSISPVPIPSTLLLFGTGLAGFIGTRVRRKKK